MPKKPSSIQKTSVQKPTKLSSSTNTLNRVEKNRQILGRSKSTGNSEEKIEKNNSRSKRSSSINLDEDN